MVASRLELPIIGLATAQRQPPRTGHRTAHPAAVVLHHRRAVLDTYRARHLAREHARLRVKCPTTARRDRRRSEEHTSSVPLPLLEPTLVGAAVSHG